ncbi:RNA methyltransferase [candidate division KSB1 bacterium]|nr:RNA methyltransferase [candidate division KSB1 bacterium]
MIQSLSKHQLKHLTALTHKKFRQISHEFLIEGIKLCEEALNADFQFLGLYVSKEATHLSRIAKIIQKSEFRQIPVYETFAITLKRLSDTVQAPGIVGHIRSREYSMESIRFGPNSLIVAVENLADPGNLGTIIRTAAWFDAQAVILDKNSVEWLNPKVIRASMGSIFHLPIIAEQELPDLILKLKSSGFSIIGTSLTGQPVSKIKAIPARKLLILGNESHGLSDELQKSVDLLLMIPGEGKAESLNVAVAGGILMHYLRS